MSPPCFQNVLYPREDSPLAMPSPWNPRKQAQNREWMIEFKFPPDHAPDDELDNFPITSPGYPIPQRHPTLSTIHETRESGDASEYIPSIEVTSPVKTTQEQAPGLAFVFPPTRQNIPITDEGLSDAASLAQGWRARALEEARPPIPINEPNNTASSTLHPGTSTPRNKRKVPAHNRDLSGLLHGYTPVSSRAAEYESFPAFRARSTTPGGVHRRNGSISSLISNPNEVTVGRVVQLTPDLEGQRLGLNQKQNSVFSALSVMWRGGPK
ncbi:hypothetical protein P154DRAFT_605210 [Amniculicola lignicola CBS 123094]|uniref:Uncharacterized protein n=1 Tax=Amniculicola lignicola CBS 123094 TaxID=1392246 RepID=A0A6A5WF03_9PLEO|nr:hypothetical protein P154DRAFT_605210 [Amniculicola lignicola CBS 123094]